jgi:hypothetical protein
MAIGKLNNDDSNKYLHEHTIICIAAMNAAQDDKANSPVETIKKAHPCV